MRLPSMPSMPSSRFAVLVLCALLALSCGGAPGEEDGTQLWRFAIEEPVGSVQWAYAQEFRRLLEERSEGRITVEVYPYGSLGTSDQVSELLRMGTIQLAAASPGHLGKLIPEVQVLLLHYVFSTDAEVNRDALRDRELKAMFDRFYAEKGFRLLSIFQEGWQVWTTRTEILEPEDFAGVRMRVMTSPMLLAAYQAYGASPTPLPYGEVYSGLQLRMIDGQVNPVFAIEEMSFYEVVDYMIFANQLPFVTTVAGNEEFFEDLEPETREMVDGIVDDLQDYIFDLQTQINEERMEIIRERRPDLEIVELTDAQTARFREAAKAVRDEFVERVGPSGEATLDALLEAVRRAEELHREGDTGTMARDGEEQSPASASEGDSL